MIEYILKSALSLGLLYSLFFAFLSRETFHRFNRACLIMIMLASLVLPLVHVTVSRPTAINDVVYSSTAYLSDTPIIIYKESAHAPLTWEGLLTVIYLAGVTVMVLVMAVQIVKMKRLMSGGLRHTDEHGNTIILKNGVASPFSILRTIVMDVDDYENHRQSILTHEQEHIRLHHTLDLLLLEAMRVMQWFNPFVWFMGNDLRAIHEYEADEAVINKGIDAKQYQQLLVLKAVGNRLQPFANNLRRGSLKQRIVMMYQKKSNRWMMLKALFVIPTMGFAIFAFATPEQMPDMKSMLKQRVDIMTGNNKSENTTAVEPTKLQDSLLDRDNEGTDNALKNDSLFKDATFILNGRLAKREEIEKLATPKIVNMTVIKNEESKQKISREMLNGMKVKGDIIIINTNDNDSKQEGITTKVTPAVEEKPDKEAHYDGDEAVMYQFIARNIRYPKEAQYYGFMARCISTLTINEDGSIANISTECNVTNAPKSEGGVTVNSMKMDNAEADDMQKAAEKAKEAFIKETERTIKAMPKFIPAEKDGKKVKSTVTLPITFRLN